MLILRNRSIPSQETEEVRGDRAPRGARFLSPANVIAPPRIYENRIALLKSAKRRLVKPMNAATFLRTFVAVQAGADAVNALPQNQGFRNSLIIRNASTSAGTLLVGLGYAPTSELDCDIELTPGGALIQDYSVSQDDIWLFASAGANASVTYSLR